MTSEQVLDSGDLDNLKVEYIIYVSFYKEGVPESQVENSDSLFNELQNSFGDRKIEDPETSSNTSNEFTPSEIEGIEVWDEKITNYETKIRDLISLGIDEDVPDN
ncbi:11824_t:CDS:1 [Funneliformis geosporum]|nr:11824_t:CDS:1 [Funneliformis geosporum]